MPPATQTPATAQSAARAREHRPPPRGEWDWTARAAHGGCMRGRGGGWGNVRGMWGELKGDSLWIAQNDHWIWRGLADQEVEGIATIMPNDWSWAMARPRSLLQELKDHPVYQDVQAF